MVQDLIMRARHDLHIYQHPNLEQFRRELDRILDALGESTIGHDHITSIDEQHGELVISTEYSLRCCAMTEQHKIPLEIINAADPIQAARQLLLDRALHELQETRRRYQQELDGMAERRETLQRLILETAVKEAQFNQRS